MKAQSDAVTWCPITAGWLCFGVVTDAHGLDFPWCIFMEIPVSSANSRHLSMLFTDDGGANNGKVVGAVNVHGAVVSEHGNWG